MHAIYKTTSTGCGACTMRFLIKSSIMFSFIAKREIQIPYVMTASTPETGETCTENGILTVNQAFEAQISGGDYKDEKMTKLCSVQE